MKKTIIFMLIFSTVIYSQVGRVTNVTKGLFKLTTDGVVELKKGSIINAGDKIKSIRAQGEITFNDLTKIIISRNSKLIIEKYNIDNSNRDVTLNLKSGSVKIEVPKKYNSNNFKVKTKLITISVKGTIFAITQSNTNGVELNVIEGDVIVNSNFGKFVGMPIKTNQTLTIVDENSTPNIEGMDTMKLRSLKIEYNINSENKKELKRFENISIQDAGKKADKYIVQMRSILQNAFRSLKKARKEKNLLKINCVNDNVMTIKGYLRRSEDNRTDIDSDNKTKNISLLLGKIYAALGNSKQAAIAIKSCSGDILTYEGDKNVDLEIDDIDAKPYDDNVSISTDVITIPTPVSPFF